MCVRDACLMYVRAICAAQATDRRMGWSLGIFRDPHPLTLTSRLFLLPRLFEYRRRAGVFIQQPAPVCVPDCCTSGGCRPSSKKHVMKAPRMIHDCPEAWGGGYWLAVVDMQLPGQAQVGRQHAPNSLHQPQAQEPTSIQTTSALSSGSRLALQIDSLLCLLLAPASCWPIWTLAASVNRARTNHPSSLLTPWPSKQVPTCRMPRVQGRGMQQLASLPALLQGTLQGYHGSEDSSPDSGKEEGEKSACVAACFPAYPAVRHLLCTWSTSNRMPSDGDG